MRGNFRRFGAAVLGLVVAAGLVTTAAPVPAHAESNGGVRVMPLGDSITDGYNVPGGYRINLWQRLAAGRYTVDFVGSGFNGPASLGDHDHEGHSGLADRPARREHRRLAADATRRARSCCTSAPTT